MGEGWIHIIDLGGQYVKQIEEHLEAHDLEVRVTPRASRFCIEVRRPNLGLIDSAERSFLRGSAWGFYRACYKSECF